MSFQEYSRLVAANFANLPTSWTDSFVHFAIDHINEQTLTAQILVTEGYQVKAYDTYWVLDITWTGTHWQKTALTVQRVPIPDEQQ